MSAYRFEKNYKDEEMITEFSVLCKHEKDN